MFGEAEVRQLELHPVRLSDHQDVLRLQVHVDDVASMQEVKRQGCNQKRNILIPIEKEGRRVVTG